MEYQIRCYTNEQIDEYLDCLRLCHRAPKKIDYENLRYKLGNDPYRKFFFVALSEDQIASRCSIFERKLFYKNDIIDCFEIGGTWTSEKHRRKGLFRKLVTLATETGFKAGAKFIYGTPNAQSAPGYKKFGYSFVNVENSFLILIPKLTHIVLNKAGINKNRNITYVRRGLAFNAFLHSMQIKEINFAEYMKNTKNFKRMNYADEQYFRHRFLNVSLDKYRFFHGKSGYNKFYCALKTAELDFLKNIVVSEYYLNGVITNSMKKMAFLKTIASAYYRNYDGIYLKSFVNKSLWKYFNMAKNKFIVHRTLPICYKFNNISQDDAHNIMSEMVTVFQMSDCDIG